MPFNIFYFDRWQHPTGLEMLSKEPAIELVKLHTDEDETSIWPVLQNMHGYQIKSARDESPPIYHITPEFLQRCPQLLVVSANGAGYDPVDIDACTEAGVIAVNQAGGNKEPVAEHTLAMMISLAKKIISSDRALRRDRNWQRNDFIGNDIFGKTIGLIGLGHIGTRVAELCRIFQMPILAYDPYLSAEQIRQRGAQAVSLETLLKESDFVSVHCPRNAQTMAMLGPEQFALMKPSAYFISTARGGIHDENALVEALNRQSIAGAGLDVWSLEPPPLDHPLLQFDNVIVTPHTAGVTHEGRQQVSVTAAEQWFEIIRGQKPSRLLNPEVWPRYKERFRDIIGTATAD